MDFFGFSQYIKILFLYVLNVKCMSFLGTFLKCYKKGRNNHFSITYEEALGEKAAPSPVFILFLK